MFFAIYHIIIAIMSGSAVGNPIQIGLLLLPAFNSMAANSFVDPFRAANYLHGTALYQWHFLSLDGNPVTASNGVVVCQTIPYHEVGESLDLLVVNASWTPENFRDPAMQLWLRRMSQRSIPLVGIDTGAFVLAFAGLMNGYRTVVHYEHLDSFQELFPQIEVKACLYVIDRDRFTCCGGVAAVDLALEIIGLQQGMTVASAAARYIFHERLRGGEERQLSRTHEPIGYAIPEVLRKVFLLMEQNLEEPKRLPELAQRAGVSQRQLERLFQQHVGLTPKRYYLNLRLNRARALLTQTELSLAEIAAACGFNSTEHFTRSYKDYFDTVPSLDRTDGRIPFQFRPFPGYSGIRQ